MQEVHQAYSVLIDPRKRAIYDKYGVSARGLDLDQAVFDGKIEDGADVIASVHLTFEQGVFGCVRTITLNRMVTCNDCQVRWQLGVVCWPSVWSS